MIKKAAVKATVGTAAASLLFLPGATMVAAPSLELMACSYPDSVVTTTELELAKSVVRRGERNQARVEVRSSGPTPRGEVRLTIRKDTRNGSKVVWGRTKGLNQNGVARFKRVKTNLAPDTYEVRAQYLGKCRFRDSSDTDFMTVRPRR
ncbi:hypothetical protein G7072_00255 [Nocardioides sp. HDW12B]|uniref:Ig-like domain repeat protein n=1 Tax=Nocardioides sp. HDW12B TaxID=2714939 RepID=UPI001407E4C4|nr:Ig-like domain repeat protein [Nocardioides sp. HDW12B]QIK64974.1 hypothetical protein G7072_00255 [Nocardioides sp. HDW12B]